ncbi:MAG TPA: 3-hydroxyacyl-CoA dehydrogenase NAD-binding domain-containing protein [Burkholderiales bacterium]|nr:3-hydroxyacyl-CoA dehydrogenase NAD-binding domain-containing protein [Burkholderiales bacterium]
MTQLVELGREGDVAVLTVSNPPVNTINAAVRAALAGALKDLGPPKALVLRCEGNTFFSGADIGEFSGPPQEEAYRRLFNAIEAAPFPVVAAMHGTVMGGGLEIALACHYRVAAPGTRFGLPEVTLGIIPGAGGTQRMPRLAGIEQTLELVLGARPVDTARAIELGFLDQVVEGDLRAGAVAFARGLSAPRRTADRKVDAVSEAVLESFREKARKQHRNQPAPLIAIEAIAASARLPLAEGLEHETKLVNELKATTESKALVHVFFAERETRKIPGIGAKVKLRPVTRAGIVGAGTMGGGIAICFANAGIPVTVIDANEAGLQKGLAVVAQTYDGMIKRGRLTEGEKAQRMALIQGSLDYDSIKDADVVIEAVFESPALKKEIFRKLDAVMKPGAVLATNTSTLDIEDLAAAVKRPQDVIGLHFFSPANVMPLLEVVRTKDTAPDVIRTALDLARPLRKTPVLAKVCYGFIGNRMMEGYAREAERMVLEGATPRAVDSTLERWGMAMGILAVFDMAGIGVGVSVHQSNADKYPPDPTYYQADFALYEAGREGQKNGKGYYRYEGRERIDDPEAIAILAARARELGVPQRPHGETEVLERCLYPLMNVGFRILEEGVAVRASDIDVVWTSGYGFPRYRGGPMFYAETVGLPKVLEVMLKYKAALGEPYGSMHWQPAPLLERLVREGKSLADWEQERSRRD